MTAKYILQQGKQIMCQKKDGRQTIMTFHQALHQLKQIERHDPNEKEVHSCARLWNAKQFMLTSHNM